ncbi:MAG: type III secretion system export apparatus subunit SctR [Polyangiales bacterium]
MRHRLVTALDACLASAVVLLPHTASAQSASRGSESFAGQPIVSMVALVALSLLPFAFMTMTSFTKMSVVFSLLRNALGAGQVPSGLIISALAAVLSLYVMAPVFARVQDAAAPAVARVDRAAPFEGDSLDAVFEAVSLGAAPLAAFLAHNAGERERVLFLDLARRARPADQRDSVQPDDFLVVLPAFVVTELAEAFQIGFLIFLPFLVVDMVVANILLALGMHMMSPTTVSLPFKLLLFVMIDGFYLLSRALVLGYAA